MRNVNYKSDFDFIMRLKDCADDTKTVPFPDCDFEAMFWTSSKTKAYIASCKGGVCTNCFRTKDGDMHFVFDNQHMGLGTLHWEPHFELPNDLYSDSIQDLFRKASLDIKLVDGDGDCPTTAEIEFIAPFIKGDAFTYADFTPEQITELQKPAVDAATEVKATEKAVKDAETLRVEAEKKRVSAEDEREASETVRQTEESTRQTDEQTRQTNEQTRQAQEQSRQTAENARADAENARATEFAGFADEIDEAKRAVFIDLWNSRAGAYGSYNADTGYFELNGILDISYAEALDIMNHSMRFVDAMGGQVSGALAGGYLNIRTAMPVMFAECDTSLDLNAFAHSNGKIEVVRFVTRATNNTVTSLKYAFYYCVHLKHVYGEINLKSNSDIGQPAFNRCRELETLKIRGLPASLWLGDSIRISYESLDFITRNASVSNAKTVTVHPKVYAKLTGADETLTEEEAARWASLVPLAAQKNITFTST